MAARARLAEPAEAARGCSWRPAARRAEAAGGAGGGPVVAAARRADPRAPGVVRVRRTPRKLQADELATAAPLQGQHPPSSTSQTSPLDAFTLDVLEVPQGSGSGFVWDKLSHIVTNFHVICGASDLRLEQRGRLDQQGRLELAKRRRRRLELPDRRPNLSNNSKEDATRYLVSLGDLIDVEKLGGSAAGSDTLHLRVTGMANAGLLSAMRDYTIRISTS
ncbi:hypothetical protein ZWY2020_054290 [Hordeum vulgare]|nr:hypothetical protein ZWY2020_054290 [Hordeum vulgare]